MKCAPVNTTWVKIWSWSNLWTFKHLYEVNCYLPRFGQSWSLSPTAAHLYSQPNLGLLSQILWRILPILGQQVSPILKPGGYLESNQVNPGVQPYTGAINKTHQKGQQRIPQAQQLLQLLQQQQQQLPQQQPNCQQQPHQQWEKMPGCQCSRAHCTGCNHRSTWMGDRITIRQPTSTDSRQGHTTFHFVT